MPEAAYGLSHTCEGQGRSMERVVEPVLRAKRTWVIWAMVAAAVPCQVTTVPVKVPLKL